jgi:hypothetical protein
MRRSRIPFCPPEFTGACLVAGVMTQACIPAAAQGESAMDASEACNTRKTIQRSSRGVRRRMEILAGYMERILTPAETNGRYCMLERLFRLVQGFRRTSRWIKRRATSWKGHWRSPALVREGWSASRHGWRFDAARSSARISVRGTRTPRQPDSKQATREGTHCRSISCFCRSVQIPSFQETDLDTRASMKFNGFS